MPGKNNSQKKDACREMFEAIVDNISEGIMLIDTDYTIREVNPATCKMLERSKDEIIGEPCYKVSHGLSQPCSERCPLRKVLQTGKSAKVIHEHFTKEGFKIYVEIIASPIKDKEGKVAQIIQISKDITEDIVVKLESDLLSKVNDLLDAGVKREKVFNIITQGLTSLFGYKLAAINLLSEDKNSLVCKSISLDPYIVAEIERLTGLKAVGYKIPLLEGSPLAKVVKTKEAVIVDDIIKLIKSHTKEKHLRALAPMIKKLLGIKWGLGVPLLAGDKLVGSIGVGSGWKLTKRDADRLARFGKQAGLAVERAMLYEDLEKAYEELKSLDEIKTNIISNVSHELRTPLTIAKGAIEIAEEENNEEERKKLLAMAKAALIRQNSVIGDLMDISKISKGSLKPQIRKVDLKLVITSSVKEMEPLALKKKIKIKTSLEEGLPEVAADFKELRHVLINLLSNAIKFNKEGGKVLIEAERKGEFVEVCIADTGIGIPQKYLPKIFDRFYQIDSGVTRKYGGTGLGLAIVKEIIELYGGQVKVESEVGKGSKFTFTVPMWKKGNSTICK